jgi:hypothetical protein
MTAKEVEAEIRQIDHEAKILRRDFNRALHRMDVRRARWQSMCLHPKKYGTCRACGKVLTR